MKPRPRAGTLANERRFWNPLAPMKRAKRRFQPVALCGIAFLTAAASPAQAGSIVRFRGGAIEYSDLSGAANDVTLTDYAGRVVVSDSAGIQAATAGCTRNDSFTFTCTYAIPVATYRVALVRVGNGSDRVRYRAVGGPPAGWDRTRTYDGAGDDVIYGSNGEDVVYAGDGDDAYYLGDGDDTVRVNETLTYKYKVKCSDCGGGQDIAYGGRGNDTLGGGRGDDLLYGGPGDDRLTGHGGSDLLTGGGGHDILDGRPGRSRFG